MMKRITIFVSVVLPAVVMFSTHLAAQSNPEEELALAEVSSADLSALSRVELENLMLEFQDELKSLNDRMDVLEDKGKEMDWAGKIKFSGDFRYRFESYDREGSSRRNRQRIRARIYLDAKIHDQVKFKFGVATGVGDPVSTNQTLGNAWGEKALWLDMAQIDYQPVKNSCNLNVIAGKMKNPFAVMSKTELLWDPDLRPEGIAVKFSADLDSFSIFGNAGGFYIQENGSGPDPSLWGGQAGCIVPLGDHVKVTAGTGYYDYGNVKNMGPFYDGDLFGNTADGGGGFNEDFDDVELFGQCEFDVMEQPVAVFGNYAKNIAADKRDKAWLAGFKVGKVKEAMSWDFRYQYKKVEADSVFGTFTDSDFGGGGTDSKGHEFNVGFGLARNCKLAVTYFLNRTGISGPDDLDYDRLQVDFKFKF